MPSTIISTYCGWRRGAGRQSVRGQAVGVMRMLAVYGGLTARLGE